MRRFSFFVFAFCLCHALLPLSHSEEGPPADWPTIEEHSVRAAEAATVSSVPAVDDPDIGLREVQRVRFPPPLSAYEGFQGFPGSPYVVAYGGRGQMFSLNPTSGELLNWHSYGNSGFREAIGGDDNRRRIILPGSASWWSRERTRILDGTDPSNVFEIADSEPCGTWAAVIPGAAMGIVSGDGCRNLIDLDTGEILKSMGSRGGRVYGALRNGVPAVLIQNGQSWNDLSYSLYSLENPARPVLWYTAELVRDARLYFDRSYTIFVAASGSGARIHDLASGRLLASIPPPAADIGAAIVEGDGARVLAHGRRDGVELFDLTDPAAPRSIATVEMEILRDYRSLKAHPSEPWLAVLTEEPSGVTVLDARDGSVLLRHETPDLVLRTMTWTETGEGVPAIALFGYLSGARTGEQPEGGYSVIETVRIDPAGGDEPAVRMAPVVPQKIQAVLPVAGRYAAVLDLGVNAVLLVDGSDGSVSDATGYDDYGVSDEYEVLAASGGDAFVAGSAIGLNVFDVVQGNLIRRESLSYLWEDCCINAVEALSDGTVVILHREWIETRAPDGAVGRLSLDRDYLRMRVNGDGTRAALSSGKVWYGSNDATAMIDLADRSSPRLLWERTDGAHFADFVRDGSVAALTVTAGWYGFAPRLVDTATGEPLGDAGEAAPTIYYYAPGAAYGTGAGSRLVYWYWTAIGWGSAVYDVGTGTPALLNLSEEYFCSSDHTVRSDGKSAYEFRSRSVYLAQPDGSFRPYGVMDADQARQLRYGFLIGRSWTPPNEWRDMVFVRDPEMNRPPTATAGPDQVAECDASGVPVLLDGSGSSDPDSTPGTDDDIALYAWTVDGDPAGDGETVEVSLGLGSHAISLMVTDQLGLIGIDEAVVNVEDTLPPELNLYLEPVLRPGPVWANEWQISVTATDQCDGDLEPGVWVSAVLDGEISYVPAGSNSIELRSGRKGSEVLLYGPDRAFLDSILSRGRQDGGLAVEPGLAVGLVTLPAPPRGVHRDTVAVYRLDDAGMLAGAAAYGEGADLWIISRAQDRSGHESEASLSLREIRLEFCAEAPGNLECLSGENGS
ncbi:MAG: hypothetical protein IFK94_13000 [Acidobacteria bacterium]|uniref:PKD/Chitinase domain-containing protein n=1 Tax=Candidatus Polarisedimenticola svalbardensis TaxID=2886004 RepID=A0A8J6Y460_9BACT|nr:hypothetical protein [Candidatus Polarisedimenticola svalbardensis]